MVSDRNDAVLPITQYWHASEPPAEVTQLMSTFGAQNPGDPHRVFDELDAEAFIEDHYTGREVDAFRSCAVPAMQADYFRYCAVLALGGAYVDAGFRCRAPLRALLRDGASGVLFRRDPPGYLLNGFFAFRSPGHPLLRLSLEIATANIERRSSEKVQMVTGPWIFSCLAILHRLLARDASPGGPGEEGGSLTARFRREASRLALTRTGRDGIEEMAEPMLEAIGAPMRVSRAFDGVRIAPLAEMDEYVDNPREPLAYKAGETYWVNWQKSGTSIFR